MASRSSRSPLLGKSDYRTLAAVPGEGNQDLIMVEDVYEAIDDCVCFFFFFSSRRRHTILVSDWSSDVCSSDLAQGARSFGGEVDHAVRQHDVDARRRE